MNEAIEKLMELYKVDNSRETTDKIAEALRVAVEALEECLNSDNVHEVWYHQITKEALQQIQQIAESN